MIFDNSEGCAFLYFLFHFVNLFYILSTQLLYRQCAFDELYVLFTP